MFKWLRRRKLQQEAPRLDQQGEFPLLILEESRGGYGAIRYTIRPLEDVREYYRQYIEGLQHGTIVGFTPYCGGEYFGFCDCDCSTDLGRTVAFLKEHDRDFSVWESSPEHYWVFFRNKTVPYLDAKSAAYDSAKVPGTDSRYSEFLEREKICVVRGCFRGVFVVTPKCLQHGHSHRLLGLETRIDRHFRINYDLLVKLLKAKAVYVGSVSAPPPEGSNVKLDIELGSRLSFYTSPSNQDRETRELEEGFLVKTITCDDQLYFIVCTQLEAFSNDRNGGIVSKVKHLPGRFVRPEHVIGQEPPDIPTLVTCEDPRIRYFGKYLAEQQKLDFGF